MENSQFAEELQQVLAERQVADAQTDHDLSSMKSINRQQQNKNKITELPVSVIVGMYETLAAMFVSLSVRRLFFHSLFSAVRQITLIALSR